MTVRLPRPPRPPIHALILLWEAHPGPVLPLGLGILAGQKDRALVRVRAQNRPWYTLPCVHLSCVQHRDGIWWCTAGWCTAGQGTPGQVVHRAGYSRTLWDHLCHFWDHFWPGHDLVAAVLKSLAGATIVASEGVLHKNITVCTATNFVTFVTLCHFLTRIATLSLPGLVFWRVWEGGILVIRGCGRVQKDQNDHFCRFWPEPVSGNSLLATFARSPQPVLYPREKEFKVS